MFTKLGALFSRGGPPASPTAKVSTQVDGDNVNVVNVVVQGGATWPLPMRTTLWTEAPQDLQSVAALLRWNTRLAPLLGREAELAKLRTWAESDAPVSIQLLHAPGGQGKTRLAAEFASALEGWRHGWVDLGDFSQAEVLIWQGRCLLLVDYPEHQPAQLERLAQAVERAAAQLGQRLRILLVAREVHAIQPAFQNRPCAAWLTPPLALAELPNTSGYCLVQAALKRLSVLQGHALAPVAQADFDSWRARHPLHHSPLLATALAIDLATRAVECLSPDQWLCGPDLLGRLVEHETRWWEKTAAGHGAPSGALTTVMAWATLSGRLTDQEINQTLAADQGWSEVDLRSIYAALSAACRRVGEHAWAPVEPDLLAARFIDGWLCASARQGREEQDGAVVQVLLHAFDPPVFAALLNRLHMLAYDQTVRLGLRLSGAPHSLEQTLWAWSTVQPSLQSSLAQGLAERARWPGFSALCLQVSQRSVANLGFGASEAERAGKLHDLAVDTAFSGDHLGALSLQLQVVAIYRSLVLNGSDLALSQLAQSLSNLSNFQSELGDASAAVVSAKKSTEIFRRLAEGGLPERVSDLALSLRNLAIRFLEVRDLSEAHAHAWEAVEVRRRLWVLYPRAHEHELAQSLDIFAGTLSAIGRIADAVDAAKDAVKIYRNLVQVSPADFEADLAGCLNNLACRQRESNNGTDALGSALDAVAICRRLAQASPAAYEPSLAMSLGTLMECHAALGNVPAAIQAGSDALALLTVLAERMPAAFERYRAMTEQHLQSLRNN